MILDLDIGLKFPVTDSPEELNFTSKNHYPADVKDKLKQEFERCKH
jgi:hypothetical protein